MDQLNLNVILNIVINVMTKILAKSVKMISNWMMIKQNVLRKMRPKRNLKKDPFSLNATLKTVKNV